MHRCIMLHQRVARLLVRVGVQLPQFVPTGHADERYVWPYIITMARPRFIVGLLHAVVTVLM